MKKIVILVVFISMLGTFTVGCGASGEKDVTVTTESSYKVEQLKTETNSVVVEEVNEEQENYDKSENDEQENTESAEHSGKAEEVLFSFFDALIDQDTKKARGYMLYDDLGFPYTPLEKLLDTYRELRPQDIINIEKISDELQLIHVNMKTPEEEFEDNFLLKMVDGTWYVASGGIVSRQQSVCAEQQVKDGEVGIYLQNIYHAYNDVDTYVINVVNNTTELLRLGFVNNGAIIYENDAGKGYIDLEGGFELNPYNSGEVFFTVDSTEGPVKSIILKELMLGLQPQTSDVDVYMGEMVAN